MGREKLPLLLAGLVLVAGTVIGVFFVLRSPETAPRDLRDRRPDPELTPRLVDPLSASLAQRETDSTPQEPAEAVPAGPPQTYTRALGRVVGRLLEESGEPAALLPVSILGFSPEMFLLDQVSALQGNREIPDFVTARALTTEEGRFEFFGVEPREVHVLGIDLGGPRSAFRIVDHAPPSGGVVDLGDIVLDPFVTLRGRVLNAKSEPVAGARVRATNLPPLVLQFGVQEIRPGCGVLVTIEEPPLFIEIPPIVWTFERLLPIPRTETDADGNYVLPGVPLGLLSVVADKQNLAAGMRGPFPSGKGPERKVPDIYLLDDNRVEGLILDTNGAPIAGAEVKAGVPLTSIPAPVCLLQPAGKSDADGRFSLRGLPDGSELFVAVRRAPGQPWSTHGPLPLTSELLSIRLQARSRLLVRLRDEAGAVVPAARLFVSPEMPRGTPDILLPPRQLLRDVVLLEDGLLEVHDLTPGSYEIVGEAEGWAFARASVEVLDAGGECELVFPPAHELRVTVQTLADEEPLEWAFVSISPKGLLEKPVNRGRTDAEGSLVLAYLQEGAYQLAVKHPAYATQTIEVQVPGDPLVVRMTAGGHLRGRIIAGGDRPPQSLFFLAFPEDFEGPTDMPSFTASLENGEFALFNLVPRSYRYQVRDRLVGKGPMALFQTMQDDPLTEGSFEIVEGETTELEVDLRGADGPTATISGSVFINGRAAKDVSVRWDGDRSRSVQTDASGYFLLENASAGEGKLSVRELEEGNLFSLASSLYEIELNLLEGESRHVPVDLTVTSVSGRVLGPGILPAGQGTFVVLRRTEGDSTLMSGTNFLTGGFSFDKVPAGTYELMVRRAGSAPFSEEIVVDPRGDPVEREIRLQAAITVQGRIVLPEGVFLPTPEESESAPRRRRRGQNFLLLEDDSGENQYSRLSEDGEFSFDESRPGTYTARMILEDKAYVSAPFQVGEAGAQGILLPLAEEKSAKLGDPGDG